MKFKIDENLPVEIAMALVTKGYEASTVLEQNLGGQNDQNIAAICRRESRVVVTLDTDFGDIRAYPPSSYPGIILLRRYAHSE